MQPNPYTPGQVPRVLAGRDAELGRIRGHLSRVAAFGELGGPLLVFHAPRGVGKTSLLRESQRVARQRGFVTAWVSCTRRQPFLAELGNRVTRALQEASVLTAGAAETWRGRLDRVGVEVGLPGAKVSAELSREDTPPTPAAPIAAVEDLLHDASRRVRGRGGAGLVVFLDELHAPAHGDLAVFLNALQNLDGERTDNPLAVLGAGLPSTPEELTRAATFGERSSFVALSLLNEQAAIQAITEPAAALTVQWHPEAVEAIEQLAQGYPYFLQLIAYAAWEAARPDTGDRIGMAAVDAGLPAARDQLQTMYRARWRAATPAEREFLAAMAHSPGFDVVARRDIAAAMGRESRALSVPRDRLIDKGIIESAGHGQVRFTLPGFAEYVREHRDDGPALPSI